MSTNPFEIAAAELRLFDVDLPEYYAEIVLQALCPPGEMRVIDRREEDAPAVQRLEAVADPFEVFTASDGIPSIRGRSDLFELVALPEETPQ